MTIILNIHAMILEVFSRLRYIYQMSNTLVSQDNSLLFKTRFQQEEEVEVMVGIIQSVGLFVIRKVEGKLDQ